MFIRLCVLGLFYGALSPSDTGSPARKSGFLKRSRLGTHGRLAAPLLAPLDHAILALFQLAAPHALTDKDVIDLCGFRQQDRLRGF